MLFSVSTADTLSDWVERTSQDSLAAQIIGSKPFLRLKHISFLGALDHLGSIQSLPKMPRTRAHHSIHVAALAGFVSQQRGYSDELSRHLITAALLHDIGHPPLSHSVEPYLKQKFGYGHHEMGEMILAGTHSSNRKLHEILKSSLNLSFIKDLIAGNAKAIDGGDLFSSPINIDTIEGIIRSYGYLTHASGVLDPLKVAYASFLDTSDTRFETLDRFWKLKGFVYQKLITRDLGLIADQYSQVYFTEFGTPLDEMDLFDSEKHWQRKYHRLFSKLASIQTAYDTPSELQDQPLIYKSRSYTIKQGNMTLQRYQCSKESKRTRIKIRNPQYQVQLPIFNDG